MVRCRQSVQGEHAEHRAERRAQDRQLERDRNEMRPAVVRFAADVQWITDYVRVPLHAKPRQAAQQAARKDDGRKNGSSETNGLIETMDRHRRIRVDFSVARIMAALRRFEKLLGRLEFGEQSVKWLQLHGYSRISGFGFCTRAR